MRCFRPWLEGPGCLSGWDAEGLAFCFGWPGTWERIAVSTKGLVLIFCPTASSVGPSPRELKLLQRRRSVPCVLGCQLREASFSFLGLLKLPTGGSAMWPMDCTEDHGECGPTQNCKLYKLYEIFFFAFFFFDHTTTQNFVVTILSHHVTCL